MRRVLILALSLTMLLPVAPARASGAGPCSDDRYDTRPAMGHEMLERRTRALIACAVRRWPVAGGLAKALEVARCESGFRPRAYSQGNAGVYQQRIVYWASRARALLKPRWFPRHWPERREHGWFNARANVVLSIRMAHRSGWSAWACA